MFSGIIRVARGVGGCTGAVKGKACATFRETMRYLSMLFLSLLCLVHASQDALDVGSLAEPALIQSPTTIVSSSLRGSAERSIEPDHRVLDTDSSNATNTNATSTSDDNFITAYIWDYRPYVVLVIVCGILLILAILMKAASVLLLLKIRFTMPRAP